MDTGASTDSRSVAVTGGAAKNVGLVRSLEGHLGVTTVRFQVDPQLMGAIGAAVLAADRCRGEASTHPGGGPPG